MKFSELEKELREKLPSKNIYVNGEDGIASYYDYHGVTFREDKAEQKFVEDYIVKSVSEKTGFPIEITKWSDCNNGHFSHYFIVKQPEFKLTAD